MRVTIVLESVEARQQAEDRQTPAADVPVGRQARPEARVRDVIEQ
jgi:hypothetical protein